MATLKTRLYKHQMIAALVWYNSKLSEKFLYQFVTPAVTAQAKQYLVELQDYAKSSTDRNPAWQVEVTLNVLNPNTPLAKIEATIADENSVLFLDFDE
jgi:hypothetical protein